MALSSLQQRDRMQAEQSFAELLELWPGDAYPLQFLIRRHLVRGDARRAVSLLLAAKQTVPGNPKILSTGRGANGYWRPVRCCSHLSTGVETAPKMFTPRPRPRLRLGRVLGKLHRDHDALIAYLCVIKPSQLQCLWLGDASMPLWFREVVKQTIRFLVTAVCLTRYWSRCDRAMAALNFNDCRTALLST